MRWLFLIPVLLWGQSEPGFPFYSSESIANAASNVSGSYAPNTLISIYGNNLSVATGGLSAADVQDGSLPTVLTSTFVSVLVGGRFANMIWVSPRQINILIPTSIGPGPANIQVVRGGRAGPAIRVDLTESAPGLFEGADGFVIATHGNGPVVTEENPAERGEVIVLYATGLGPTNPMTVPNRVASSAAWLVRKSEFEVRLDGVTVPRDHILYAGVTPGFGGLFQINLKVPEGVGRDPEIRVGTPERMSPGGRRVRVQVR